MNHGLSFAEGFFYCVSFANSSRNSIVYVQDFVVKSFVVGNGHARKSLSTFERNECINGKGKL